MTTLTDVALPQVNLLGSTMAYREAGDREAPVALFLHGNPTSSYVWRNVLPHIAPVAHCIAPDLIGFGQSGKPDIEYRVADHVRYLDAFLDHAGILSAFVIAQDWGTALAFLLAARRPEFSPGACFYGVYSAHSFMGWLCSRCHRDFPEVQDAGSRRRDDSRKQLFRGGDSSRGNRAKTDGGGDVCLQSSLSNPQVATAHLAIPK